ncbi:MAG: SUMF1/EgtB/PvdO family nonheme iron enzyme, partial [Alphaproteobacteria bacterium]|nr:SUMF1/EgtB/PvdO family nonheme iron enzyme [Alphaproteobacteria bacterium]
MADADSAARFKGTGKPDPVRISNVVVKPSGEAGAADVTFDLAWDWSWRAAWQVKPEQHGGKETLKLENWDAAWVFVKFRKPGADGWKHAILSTDKAAHKAPTGAALDLGSTDDGKRGIGAFVYRASKGHGANNWKGVSLRWLHPASSPDKSGNSAGTGAAKFDPSKVELKVLAVEMVRVPQCAFWLGDGTTKDVVGTFSRGTGVEPFRITGEQAIGLGSEDAQNLGTRDSDGMFAETPDDFNRDRARRLPASFPKGYAGFYCMKYEVTQQQYVDYLNLLSYRDQCRAMALNKRQRNAHMFGGRAKSKVGTRFDPKAQGNTIEVEVPGVTPPSTPLVVDRKSFVASASIEHPGTPARFKTSTPHVACNGDSQPQVAAYCAWAGLRPMTELEYEKACRGPLLPVANEYAWGTTDIDWTRYHNGNKGAPRRVGAFTTPESDRVQAGASYWGILDLSGNVLETTVGVG